LTDSGASIYCILVKFMDPTHILRGPRALVLAAIALGCAGTARCDLAPSSPFLPRNQAGAAAQGGPSGPVELRGVMATSEGFAYCIYDTVKKTSSWVGLGEGGHDFIVKSADAGGENVTVDFKGQILRLALRTAKVSSSGPAGVAASAVAAPPATSPVLNPTAADEQRRLDAVAAEVRRRKMERERAIQDAQNSGVQPSAPNR
jgi:hypothetical protein